LDLRCCKKIDNIRPLAALPSCTIRSDLCM
jgi:hypothetical protein